MNDLKILKRHKDRLRLQRAEAKQIAERLKQLGFRVSVQTEAVHAWDKGHSGWCVSFRWIKKQGWRLDIATPTIKTHHDLETALDEIETTRHHRKLADEAWAVFQKCRSNKAWMAFQGVMAAHFARLGAIPRKEPTNEQG